MNPTWITKESEGEARFLIDGDAACQSVLPDVNKAIARRRSAESDEPISADDIAFDRYVAAVVYVFVRLDAQVAIAMNHDLGDKWKQHRMKGGPDYKQNWGVKHQQSGKHEDLWAKDPEEFMKVVSSEAKALYKSVRSVMPS